MIYLLLVAVLGLFAFAATQSFTFWKYLAAVIAILIVARLGGIEINIGGDPHSCGFFAGC
jgi:hypothetical protein